MNRRYSFSNKTLWLKGRIFRPSPDVWLLLKGPSNCTQWRRVNIGNIATAAHSLRLYLSLSASQHIVFLGFFFFLHTLSNTWKQWHIMYNPHRSYFTSSTEVRGQRECSRPGARWTLMCRTQTRFSENGWFPTWSFKLRCISWQIGSLITRGCITETMKSSLYLFGNCGHVSFYLS